MKSHDGHHDVIISHTGVLRHLVTSVLARSNFACVFFLLVSPARETEAHRENFERARARDKSSFGT